MKALGREELDRAAAAGCTMPGCDHQHHDGTVYFHGKCHPQARVDCKYQFGTGQLVVTCAVCQREIARVLVAQAITN